MILCFGDSITEGRPGVTYLKYVKSGRQYRNFGLGGDTLIGMSKRLLDIINDQKYHDANTVIIGIGTNDVLHPYLKSFSKPWAKIIDQLTKRGSIPCSNETDFRDRYEKLLQFLKQAGKDVIIFGIPLLETDIAELNQKAIAYNKIIIELSSKFSYEYIDIMGFQQDIKSKQNNNGSRFFSKDVFEPVLLSLLTTYLPFTDYVSKKRGLSATVDGVHMNTASAKGLAVLIENFIQDLNCSP